MTQNGQSIKKTASRAKSEARRQRQADALRANLRRRKAGTNPATELAPDQATAPQNQTIAKEPDSPLDD